MNLNQYKGRDCFPGQRIAGWVIGKKQGTNIHGGGTHEVVANIANILEDGRIEMAGHPGYYNEPSEVPGALGVKLKGILKPFWLEAS